MCDSAAIHNGDSGRLAPFLMPTLRNSTKLPLQAKSTISDRGMQATSWYTGFVPVSLFFNSRLSRPDEIQPWPFGKKGMATSSGHLVVFQVMAECSGLASTIHRPQYRHSRRLLNVTVKIPKSLAIAGVLLLNLHLLTVLAALILHILRSHPQYQCSLLNRPGCTWNFKSSRSDSWTSLGN